LVPRGGRRRSGEGWAGVWCLVSRHGMAWARRLRAAQTVAGTAGALRTGEAATRVAQAQRLTGGARRRGGPVGSDSVRGERDAARR
jgi:hypothetical protein